MPEQATRRLLAAAALGVAAVLVAVVVASSGQDGRRVTAVFQQAYGLVKGGQVLIGGAHVGEITAVGLGPDGLPRVAMRLDKGVRLHTGARADLRQLSNSGQLNRYVLLDPGHGRVLDDGALIPSDQTAGPVELDQVLGTLTPRTRADVRAVLGSFDDATDDLAPAFRAGLRHSADALQETAGTLAAVTRDTAALRLMVSQGAQVSSTLAQERPALGGTVDELSGLLTATARRERELGTGLSRLPAGLRGPRQALDRLHAALPTLEGLLRAAAPASRELQPTATQLAPILRSARPALDQVAALAREAPPRLRAVRPLLGTLRTSLGKMVPTLRYALPVLDYVRVYTPDITGLIANWASTNSTYDASGHGARILASSSAPPTTPQPTSSGAAGYLEAPYLRLPGSAGDDPWLDYTASFLAPEKDR